MPTIDRPSSSNLKDKAAKGMLWGALNSGAMQVLNAVFGIVLARQLSQADYGLIGMLTIFSLTATSLQDSGFVTALTNKRNATHSDYNSVFWFNIVVSLCLYFLLFACAPLIAHFFNEPILTSLSRYYFAGFFIASFSIVPRALLFRQMRQRELAIMAIAALLVSGTTGILMVYNDMAYWSLATQTLVFNLMVSIISWAFSGWKPTFQVSVKPIKEMFGFSSKMLITNIFFQVNNNLFSLVLGRYYTKQEVGTYTQANKWNTMGASTITGMVQGVAQPTFVQVGNDEERLRRTFGKMLRFTCFVSFPTMFGLAMVAPEFIELLVTERWLSSAHLMRPLCIGGAFLPIATLYYNLIISRGKSNVYMWNVIAQGCVILATVLIIQATDCTLSLPWVSISGIDLMVAAYVTIVVAWTGVWHTFLHREIHCSYLGALKDILPFMLVAAFTMLLTYFATLPLASLTFHSTHTQLATLLLCRIVLAATVYTGILWLFKAEILKESIGYLRKRKP